MDICGRDRGMSTVIGTLVLFAFLVIALSAYQMTAVPSQNAEVEYQHSQKVTDQLVGFRSALVNTIGTGTTQSQQVTLGTTYPPRVVGLNPAPASGTIRTKSQGRYKLSGGGLGDNTIGETCYTDPTTAAVTYKASYSQYSTAPTLTYENSIVYRQYEEETLIDASQLLVQGNTIRLGPMSGQLSTSSSGSTALSTFGGQEGTTTISPDSSFTLTVPTQLPAAEWRTNDQLFNLDDTPDSETVIGSVVQNGSDTIDVELEAGEYSVICRPVSVNTAPPAQTPPDVTISRATHEEVSPKDYKIEVTFEATDEESFKHATYNVTTYESSAMASRLGSETGSYAGGSKTVSYQITDPGGQSSDSYYVVVEVMNNGQTESDGQETTPA